MVAFRIPKTLDRAVEIEVAMRGCKKQRLLCDALLHECNLEFDPQEAA